MTRQEAEDIIWTDIDGLDGYSSTIKRLMSAMTDEQLRAVAEPLESLGECPECGADIPAREMHMPCAECGTKPPDA